MEASSYPISSARRHRPESDAPFPYWPYYAMISLYPLWWVLGLSGFMWVILALPMAASVVRRRGLVIPKGSLWWLLFLVGVTGSVMSMDGGIGRLSGWVLRFGYYLGATFFLIFLLNGKRSVNVWRIVRPLTVLWLACVAGGYLAFVLGDLTFRTPMAYVMPQALMDNELIHTLVVPTFAQVQDIIGLPIARPATLWNSTNAWGSMLALLTPFAIISLGQPRVQINRTLIKVALAASVVPAIISLNRGLWLSLGGGVVYAAIRFGLAGDARLVVRGMIGALLLSIVLVGTPFGGMIVTRFETGHSNEDRASLATDAFNGAKERPFYGWGGPRPNKRNLPSVGTHGQVWFTMFSYGFIGFAGFFGFLASLAFWTYRQKTNAGIWAHTVIIIGLIQAPFYLQVPQQTFAILAGAAVALRLQSDSEVDLAFTVDVGGKQNYAGVRS